MTRRPSTPIPCACPRVTHAHGTLAHYTVHRCSCFACRVAKANAARSYRSGGTWHEGRRTDPTGTRRRLQALCAIGVSTREIGEHLGITAAAVSKLRTTQGLVTVDSASRVATVYAVLWSSPRTDGSGKKARTYARQQGWHPPMAWDDIDNPDEQPGPLEPDGELDEVAVERIMAGRLPATAGPERVEAIRRLAALHLSDRAIAARIGSTVFTVCKERERRGVAAGVPSTRRKGAAA